MSCKRRGERVGLEKRRTLINVHSREITVHSERAMLSFVLFR